ncbi:hypothetical protein [Lactiplantibacillus plantarum]|uniref:hypothetical protein n=1 Tax=Lactiplantibacillus plantarum TaxID=1590 RepID=UPI001323EE3A|nr:hypothetical protein [Lactiplantibacillus plantarum]KAE9506529.1 hypothetical protein FET70_03079 [Lactiplantibacillus plantarum]
MVQQTPITFQFKAAPAATGVWLVIYADGQWQTPTKVALAAVAAQTYRGEFTPPRQDYIFIIFRSPGRADLLLRLSRRWLRRNRRGLSSARRRPNVPADGA